MIDDLRKGEDILAVSELEAMFPELQESEDEKIKKEIIELVKFYYGSSLARKHTVSKDEMIAWLEKQGEHNTFSVPQTPIKDDIEVTSRMQYISYDMKPIAEFIMGYTSWNLHKDEWNKPTLTVPLFRVLDALIYRGKSYCECSQNVENQGEQKHYSQMEKCINCQFNFTGYCNGTCIFGEKKVEPKFHEGDWVVYNNDICQIVKREEGCNKLVTTFGIEKELVNERNLSTARLWTIADAKDGDVLAYKNDYVEWILIYKNIIPESCDVPHDVLKYHALLTGTDFYDSGIAGMTSENYVSCFTPATKEQREQLFKAMHEAGWEWDEEKKELRKVETVNHHEGWVNIYKSNDVHEDLDSFALYQMQQGIFETKDEALGAVKKSIKYSTYIATIKIEWEEQ